jgi:hypothetical protein
MAAALPFIGIATTAIGIGGKVLGGIAGANSSKAAIQYQMQVAKNNMQIAKYNAHMAEQQGEAKATAAGLRGRAAYGALEASEAGSGVDISSPSFVSARATQAEFNQLDAMTIKSDYAREVYGYQNEARAYKAQRDLLRSSQPKLWQTLLGIGGQVTQGAGGLADQTMGYMNSGALPSDFLGGFSGGNSALDTSALAGGAGAAGTATGELGSAAMFGMAL